MAATSRIALLLLLASPVLAQAQSTRIDVPAIDLPYNTAHRYRAPSMAQSQALTEAFYELTHRAIQQAWGDEHKWYARISIIGADIFDSLVLPLPGSDGWVHEEFHRTIPSVFQSFPLSC